MDAQRIELTLPLNNPFADDGILKACRLLHDVHELAEVQQSFLIISLSGLLPHVDPLIHKKGFSSFLMTDLITSHYKEFVLNEAVLIINVAQLGILTNEDQG